METGQNSQWQRAIGHGFKGPGRLELITPNPKLKLLEQVREVMRLKHYSLRTERTYCDWIRRCIHFHHLKSRDELLIDPEAKVELFLSDLAVRGQVAASTQNQALNALLFLYGQVLHRLLENVQAVRADRLVQVELRRWEGHLRIASTGHLGLTGDRAFIRLHPMFGETRRRIMNPLSA